jgi:hypothetical protein
MRPAALPHAYPFRFVDVTSVEAKGGAEEPSWHGRVEARLSAGSWAGRDGEPLPASVLAEAIAQAALLLQGGDPEIGRSGFLAGVDGFEVTRPPRAGDTLSISVRMAARFGAVVKFEGEIQSGGQSVARGAILVRKGEP